MNSSKALRIPLPVDFSFEECLWFLDRNYDECLHTLKEMKIIKAFSLDGKYILVSIKAEKMQLLVEVLKTERQCSSDTGISKSKKGKVTGLSNGDKKTLLDHISHWLDLERDISPFYALLNKDKRLDYMPDEYRGLRLIGIVDLFEALCWSIIGQQINLRFAFALKRRLVEKYGAKIEWEGVTHYLFPTCSDLSGITVAELRAMQFSESKARYLIGTAQAFVEGTISRKSLDGLPDLESRQKALMQLKGIGIWTANYCLMKTLREPSCIPHGDTGLLTALAKHSVIKERSEVEKIARFFKKYRGWESYLVFYLWRSLAGPGRNLTTPNLNPKG